MTTNTLLFWETELKQSVAMATALFTHWLKHWKGFDTHFFVIKEKTNSFLLTVKSVFCKAVQCFTAPCLSQLWKALSCNCASWSHMAAVQAARPISHCSPFCPQPERNGQEEVKIKAKLVTIFWLLAPIATYRWAQQIPHCTAPENTI